MILRLLGVPNQNVGGQVGAVLVQGSDRASLEGQAGCVRQAGVKGNGLLGGVGLQVRLDIGVDAAARNHEGQVLAGVVGRDHNFHIQVSLLGALHQSGQAIDEV